MFVYKITLCLAACLTLTYSQNYNGPTTTPVPILKQINRQNDDGSYSFGYEAADGSFKIETKYPNGDVAGKYGYVDESGKPREVSYGASSQRGFEPQGSGIMVPPPTLNEQTSNALSDGQEDDGQYREDPKIYEDPKYNSAQGSRPAFKQYHRTVQQPAQELEYQPRPKPQPVQSSRFTSPIFSSFGQSQNNEYRPQSQIFHQQPQFSYQAYTPQPQQPQYQNTQYQNQYQPNQYQNQYQPNQYQNQYQSNQYQNQYQPNQYQSQYQPNQNYNPFFGHPAQNFDPSTGSYSINFTG